MSGLSKTGGGGSGGGGTTTTKTQTSQTTRTTQTTQTTGDKTATQTSKLAGDSSTLSGEKEVAGATPDFSQSFGAAQPQAAQQGLSGTFRKGAQGDDVKQLQEMLNSNGAKLDVDGKFGNDTLKAVREFQKAQGLDVDGVAGKDTLGRLQGAKPGDTKPGDTKPEETKPGETKPGETTPGTGLDLPAGYESLEKLSGELGKRDARFNTDTPEGRAATAMALAIGGTEVFGKGTTATDFFTRKGGTGNKMLGFAQFNQKYHAGKTNTPEKYTKFLGDILSGDARMPNSKKGGDHISALTQAVQAGKIKNGQDLRNFMTQRGFGGSNWQGIDDGWGRNPGLANALAGFLQGS